MDRVYLLLILLQCVDNSKLIYRSIVLSIYLSIYLFIYLSTYLSIPGGPIKTEQSIQSIFQDFALINSYLFSSCWIEHLFLIIITPISSHLV